MKFDDLTVIWDEHKQKQTFVLDEAALRQSIQKSGRGVRRSIWLSEVIVGISLLAACALAFAEPLLKDKDHHQYIAGLPFLLLLIYLVYCMFRRQALSARWGKSLLSDLDLTIKQIDLQINQISYGVGLCMLACGVSLVIKFGFTHENKPLGTWLLIFLGLSTLFLVVRWSCKKAVARERQVFVKLKEKLTAETAV